MSNGYSQKISHFKRQQGRCFYCDRLMAPSFPVKGQKMWLETITWDHYQPLSRGGAGKTKNRVLCCFECNQEKGAMTGEEYIAALMKNGWKHV